MKQQTDISMSLTSNQSASRTEVAGMALAGLGILALLAAFFSYSSLVIAEIAGGLSFAGGVYLLTRQRSEFKRPAIILLTIGLAAAIFHFTGDKLIPKNVETIAILLLLPLGGMMIWADKFLFQPAGIRNNGIQFSQSTSSNGSYSWMLAVVLTGFYIMLYWHPHLLHGLILVCDPIHQFFHNGQSAIHFNVIKGHFEYNQWFMYGLFYTISVLVMGTRFIFKYRNNRYQIIRTISVSFFQLVFAFLLPGILENLNSANHPEWATKTHYFSYFWPLSYSAFFPDTLSSLSESGTFGKFIFGWSLVASFIAVPVLTYFFGKRWYCSFVCGCGGLAETAGDPFRHLSDKSLRAWKIERWLIHSILVIITLVTFLLLLANPINNLFGFPLLNEGFTYFLKNWYGFLIGSIFAGVIGTGFYPILGSRVWCRFGCPQAAILGILQKYFSRFRITTNGSQCISCGNCSTYCEMGIDVKWYAQRGQDIVRASCVGCGICSAVCPRGVLKLENGRK